METATKRIMEGLLKSSLWWIPFEFRCGGYLGALLVDFTLSRVRPLCGSPQSSVNLSVKLSIIRALVFCHLSRSPWHRVTVTE